ncbi:tetratricopeptide repeat protein [Actinomadura fulvescens]|uniref:Tetratricopeptide repeat protein n=1 Tax=Actinomadura fulvescens TaxID=46160 RepID=A0ABP6C8U1_9ACTN
MEIDGRLGRAQALLEVGRTRQARELAAGVVAERPSDVEALCLVAECLSREGDDRVMLAAAERAVAADPAYEHAHRLRALALVRLERGADAVAAAREAVRLAPGTWQGQVMLALALIGEQGQRRRAFGACRQAIALAPDEAEPHFVQGLVRHASGSSFAARRSYGRALRLDPQHSGALEGLGRLHLRAGRPVSALRHFRAAAAVDPTGVAGVAHAERVMFAALNISVLTTFFAAFVLIFGVLPGAWAVAATLVAFGVWWLWRAGRALPPPLRPTVRGWLRSNPRFAVRVWSAGGFLAVGMACGIASAVMLPADGPLPPGPTIAIAVTPMVALLVAAAMIKTVDTRADRTRPIVDQGDPLVQVTEAGWTKLVYFWLYRAGVLAFVPVFVPATSPEAFGWAERAGIGLPIIAVLALYGRHVLRRRPGAIGVSWERFPREISVLFPVGVVICVGYLLLFVVMPSSDWLADAVVAPFMAVLFFVPVQLWWMVYRLVRALRPRTTSAGRSEGPA